MRILSILITILIILSNSEQLNAQNTLETDSVAYVANRLMSYDVYINSFEISDAELDWIENDHPNWVVKFFPQIITQYDCTLYTKFALAASLYQKDCPKYLCCLWHKFGYLFEVNGIRSEEEPIKRIWELFDWLKINPKVLKGC